MRLWLAGWLIAAAALAGAEPRTGRYALVLSDAAAVGRPQAHRQTVLRAQDNMRSALHARRITVSGSVDTVMNALFVNAAPERVAELRALPGVIAVVPLRVRKHRLGKAVQMVNAPGAWNALGGSANGGAGVKIAILDFGIDVNHPAFADSGFTMPAGFPKCAASDCAFTNKKVIAARSYVSYNTAGYGDNPAANSMPDDLSARDRMGHGTAAASAAAGGPASGPSGAIMGMAPKAWLGNYKVFGSPGVNSGASDAAILAAMDDAIKDGMDIMNMSFGSSALWASTAVGGACGLPDNTPCDALVFAIEGAVKAGVMVFCAAGNEGDYGARTGYESAGTIDSPGYAASAIAVGATTNGHRFTSALRITGNNVPAALQTIEARFGNGPLPAAPVTAPLKDAASVASDGLACTALPANSLSGSVALVQVGGTCTGNTKVINIQNAGALAMVLYGGALPNVSSAAIPVMLIVSASDGQNLKALAGGSSSVKATVDTTQLPVNVTGNAIAAFSSAGPATGDLGVKPDLVAPGTDIYLAGQSFDPAGELYAPSGYLVSQGTSFSTPIAAGAAALVKQAKPKLTPGQIRSNLVNTASQDVTDQGGAPRGTAMGGGRVDAGAAVGADVTVEPSSVSFGVAQPLPVARTLTVTNTGNGAVSLSLTVRQRDSDANAQVAIDKSAIALAPGQSTTLAVTLSGSAPKAGAYEGAINIMGGATPLRVPYLYLQGSGIAYDLLPLTGDYNFGTAGETIPDGGLTVRVVDRYGVPVANAPVQWSVVRGGGKLTNSDAATDANGIAYTDAAFGPAIGPQSFFVNAAGLTYQFTEQARAKPTISAGGVVNAASYDTGLGLAPGSYITLFGSGLSDSTKSASGTSLPLQIDSATVSFDAPGVSVPGRMYYVSPGQVNVQIPWELQGQASAQVKVRVDQSFGGLVTVPLHEYSPAVFSYVSGANAFAAALDLNYKPITTQNAARRGSVIQIYANGLGPVDRTPASGEPAPMDVLARTLATPTVSVGGVAAVVSFSGLAPGFSGLYQVNVTVPEGAAVGNQELAISQGGVAAKTVLLPVQ